MSNVSASCLCCFLSATKSHQMKVMRLNTSASYVQRLTCNAITLPTKALTRNIHKTTTTTWGVGGGGAEPDVRHMTSHNNQQTAAPRSFSQSHLSVQSLLPCPYNPCVQSHASTSVRTLDIPNTGTQPMSLFGHAIILYTPIGMGSAALAAAVRRPDFITRDNEVLKKKKEKEKRRRLFRWRRETLRAESCKQHASIEPAPCRCAVTG